MQAEGSVLPRDAPHRCTEVETVCLGLKKEGIGAADSADQGLQKQKAEGSRVGADYVALHAVGMQCKG